MKIARAGLVGLVAVVASSSLVSACTATVDDASPPPAPAPDASTEAGSPPTPTPDGGTGDVERPPLKPAKRLDVSCTTDPCYLAVSGNGGEHFCSLLTDGTVRCWGRDARAFDLTGGGALGRGAPVTSLEGATPLPVVGLENVKVTQISVGRNSGTCARTSDGDVYCWGYNQYGQLGQDPEKHPRLATAMRVEGLPPVSAVALGGSTGCAIASDDGALHCWGLRGSAIGQTAAPGESPAFPPQVMTRIPRPIHELTLATFSRNGNEMHDTIVALREDNVLVTLGELVLGETSLPTGSTGIPFELPGVLKPGAFAFVTTEGVLSQWAPNAREIYLPQAASIVDVAVSARYVTEGRGRIEEQGALLLSSGRLFRWGMNNSGELGRHPMEISEVEYPLEMTHLGKAVVSFATTPSATCASLVDGKIVCWGSNENGELGRGALDEEYHPEATEIE